MHSLGEGGSQADSSKAKTTTCPNAFHTALELAGCGRRHSHHSPGTRGVLDRAPTRWFPSHCGWEERRTVAAQAALLVSLLLPPANSE